MTLEFTKGQSQVMQSKVFTSIDTFSDSEQYWKFMTQQFRNKSYNQIFEVPDDETQKDYIYILNTNNEIETNISTNPYFGEVTLMRFQAKPYLRMKESGQSSGHQKKKPIEERVIDAQLKNQNPR